MSFDANTRTDAGQRTQGLFDYALDREDIKWLLGSLPQDAGIDPNTVEYELHLLKIVSVGWAISYYLPDEKFRNSILEPFWQAVHEFARDLSRTTQLLIGKDVNYFDALRSRMDIYVQSMARLEADAAPVQAIGPEFARRCGDKKNPFAVLLGSKMFASCLSNVRTYLERCASGECEPDGNLMQ